MLRISSRVTSSRLNRPPWTTITFPACTVSQAVAVSCESVGPRGPPESAITPSAIHQGQSTYQPQSASASDQPQAGSLSRPARNLKFGVMPVQHKRLQPEINLSAHINCINCLACSCPRQQQQQTSNSESIPQLALP
eukprot:1153588-Pelagomonas_calceolata.AAC.6